MVGGGIFFFTLITQKLVFVLSGVYAGIIVWGGEVMHPKINNFFVPANNILDHHTASFRFRGSSPGIFSGFHAGLDYPHHLSTYKRTVKVDAWLALPLAWLPPDN